MSRIPKDPERRRKLGDILRGIGAKMRTAMEETERVLLRAQAEHPDAVVTAKKRWDGSWVVTATYTYVTRGDGPMVLQHPGDPTPR